MATWNGSGLPAHNAGTKPANSSDSAHVNNLFSKPTCDAVTQAHLYPRRLTAGLHTARALMQPWQHTHAVTALDAHLHTYGLLPATTPGPATKDPHD
jgi:hypothetical protein